jgi:hypothetical protein
MATELQPVQEESLQSLLFGGAVNLGPVQFDTEDPAPKGQDMEITEVADDALRNKKGEIRPIRHPIEMAAIEPKTRKLSLLSLKLWLFLTSYSLSTPAAATRYGLLWRVGLRTLAKDINWNSNDYESLKTAICECQKILVDWSSSARDSETGEIRKWASTQLLGSVEFIIDSSGRACIEWSFPPTLLRQLQEHKHYFESSLQVALKIKHHGAFALYRIASRYKSSKNGLSARKPWRDWIPALTGYSLEEVSAGAGGKDERYKEFRYFNRDVIKKAITEINLVQDEFWVKAITFSKNGARGVDELQFQTITREGYSPKPRQPRYSEDMTPIVAMTQLGLSQRIAEQLCSEHGAELCIEVSNAVLARVEDKHQTTINNVQGYLVSEISKASLFKSLRFGSNSAQVAKIAAPDTSSKSSLADYQNSLIAKARSDWPSMPIEVQEDYRARFKLEKVDAGDPAIKAAFAKAKDFMAVTMLKALFFNWLARDQAGSKWEASSEDLLAFERGLRLAAEKHAPTK